MILKSDRAEVSTPQTAPPLPWQAHPLWALARRLTLLLLALLPGTVWSLTITDPRLEAAIRSALAKPTGPLSSTDMLSLTGLGAANLGITNLTGLEGALNLQYLNLDFNQVSDLTPLTKLTALRTLYLDNNRLSSAAALAGLTNLNELTGDNNSLHDASWLAKLTRLSSLSLMFNPIGNSTAYGGLTNLSDLHLNGTGLSDVSWLSKLHNLLRLGLGDNNLTNASPVAGLSQLQFLGLGGMNLGSCTVLAGLTNLQTLYLFGEALTDVSCLAGLKKLSWLRLSDNNLSNIAPLGGLTQLGYLDLSGNRLTNGSALAPLSRLQQVDLSYNLLADLNFAPAWTSLTNLEVSYNQLSDISGLLGMLKLGSVDLRNEPLDLTPGSPAYNVIQALLGRGVSVELSLAPQLLSQPTNLVAALGGSAVFTVLAEGSAPLTYQWRFNQTNLLSGATNAVLSLNHLTLNQAGAYTVTVTNNYGSVTSASSQLTVSGTPGAPSLSAVTTYLSSTNALTGVRTLTLKATINPNNLPTVAYFQFGPTATYAGSTAATNLPAGGTATDFFASIDALAPGVLYHYRAVATNSLGLVTSPDQTFQIAPLYVPGDSNGDGIVDQNELNAVLANYWPSSPWLAMTNTVGLGSTNVQFALTNANNWNFSVLVSTNLVDWVRLGAATPLYQFGDPAATNAPRRFYRLSWP